MKAKGSVAHRHPKVLMICESAEDVAGAAEVISAQIEAFRVLPVSSQAVQGVKDFKPYVLLIALKDIKKAIGFYTKLVKDKLLNYPHESILLCENKQSGAAFRCCVKGIFSDYFVHKPMYENYRLKMIVHKALQRSSEANDYKEMQEENFGRLDEDLKQIIDDAAHYTQNAARAIEQTRTDAATIDKQVEAQVAKMNPAEIVALLNEKHINPLLAQLESELEKGVNDILHQLLQHQTHLKRTAASTEQQVTPSHPELADNNQEQTTREEASPVAPPAAKKRDSLGHILVVEDNEVYQGVLTRILVDHHYSVDACTDGLDAIKKLQSTKYDLVFMDLYLPQLDGLNTTKNIRKIPLNKSVPVVALTSNKNKETIRKWAQHGLAGYLMKPATKGDILKAVEKIHSS